MKTEMRANRVNRGGEEGCSVAQGGAASDEQPLGGVGPSFERVQEGLHNAADKRVHGTSLGSGAFDCLLVLESRRW